MSSALQTDIDETKRVLTLTTNESLLILLGSHLAKLEKQLKEQQAKEQQATEQQVTTTNATTETTIPDTTTTPPLAAPAPAPAPAPVATKTPILPGAKYIPVEDYYWDQAGGFNSPTVSVTIPLDGVGKLPRNQLNVEFSKHAFDFSVTGLDGKNYRLVKDNLEKNIAPAESSMVVKANKVILKLQKVKGEYSFDNWNNLTSKKPREAGDDVKAKAKTDDPMGGLMSMMKDMYEDGDENMKKIIGEAMLKSQRGEKTDPAL